MTGDEVVSIKEYINALLTERDRRFVTLEVKVEEQAHVLAAHEKDVQHRYFPRKSWDEWQPEYVRRHEELAAQIQSLAVLVGTLRTAAAMSLVIAVLAVAALAIDIVVSA